MKSILLFAVTAVFASTSFSSIAQDPKKMGAVLAKTHGSIDQMSLNCGMMPSVLKEVKLQRLSQEQNMPVAILDRLYEQGAHEVKMSFATLNSGQKQESCRQAKQEIRPLSR